MNKNIKRMFLLTTLILLLVGITATAAVDTNDTNIGDDSSITTNAIEKSNDATIIDNNKNIQTTNNDKNIKKAPESTVNYYVSDSEGNDENDGSQTSPFKTINTAISKTNSENIYNIYMKEPTKVKETQTLQFLEITI